MPQALIRLSENANRALNVVKAKHALKDKSAAIEFLVTRYIEDSEDPELRPEFVEELKRIAKEPGIRVDDFAARYRLDEIRTDRAAAGERNLRKAPKKGSSKAPARR